MLNTDPVDHTAYIGSDEKYHYVVRSLPMRKHVYRVPISELKLRETFPLDKGSPYVLTHEMLE